MCLRFLCFLFFSCTCLIASSKDVLEDKDLKILVLIIATDDKPYYRLDQETWRSYMHLNPKQVKSYFIKSDPNLNRPVLIKGDVIWSKAPETYMPGIMDKTIWSMKAAIRRMGEFDYVVRTNVSSFYHFPRLLEFLKTAPRKEFYCGVTYGYKVSPSGFENFRHVSGDGVILSKDLVKMMLENESELVNQRIIDDILMGEFLLRRNILPTRHERMELTNRALWEANKDKIPEDTFQFRVKNDFGEALRESDEVFIQRQLVNMFYGDSIWP